MCLLFPYQLNHEMNFMLCFLLNLSITPLPAKEFNKLYAAFHTKFMSIICLAALPKKVMSNFVSKLLSVSPLLSRRSALGFVPNLRFVFVVKWDDLYCVIFSV